MLTNLDIQKISGALRTVVQEEAASKNDMQELRGDFNLLQKSVDNLARTVYVHDQELKIINHRLDKLENPAG